MQTSVCPSIEGWKELVVVSRLLREAIAGQRWLLLGAVLLLAGWQAAEALVPVLVGVTSTGASRPGPSLSRSERCSGG